MFDKKIIKVMLLLVACAFLFLADQFTSNTYDLTLFEYFKYSSDITEQEREYLQKRKLFITLLTKTLLLLLLRMKKMVSTKGW
ncbi:hypothetical protein [Sedimentibacter sp. B4]|uniref:hypothetical protein n=1 Tax=Sedimentibacter sp. B4 TaxID=304766 RepID=UPI00030279AB|nr:hypothetical protein [Sedimentibacter sp. B4]